MQEITLDEIARELGVSRERVRQLEIQGISKCRQWCETNGYRPEDLLPDPPRSSGYSAPTGCHLGDC